MSMCTLPLASELETARIRTHVRCPAAPADRPSDPSPRRLRASSPVAGGRPVSELRSEIDGLAAVDVAAMPSAELGAHIRELCAARDRLDGQIERAITEFDTQGMCEADGAQSTASWLRGRCLLPGSEASARVRTARMLRELPRTAAALEAGDISLGHARAIAMLAADTDAETTRGVEEQLIEVA